MNPTPRVFVITGPSGVGKGTLISNLMKRVPNLELSISATTRKPRPGEEHGVDYFFLEPDEFDRRVAAGDFLEHAAYSSNQYGTLRSEVEHRVAAGHTVLLEIELQGARQIRSSMPEAIQVFVAPPTHEHLRERLEGRGTDHPDAIEARLKVAEEEMEAREEFHHQVINDDIDRATDELERIVMREVTELP